MPLVPGVIDTVAIEAIGRHRTGGHHFDQVEAVVGIGWHGKGGAVREHAIDVGGAVPDVRAGPVVRRAYPERSGRISIVWTVEVVGIRISEQETGTLEDGEHGANGRVLVKVQAIAGGGGVRRGRAEKKRAKNGGGTRKGGGGVGGVW